MAVRYEISGDAVIVTLDDGPGRNALDLAGAEEVRRAIAAAGAEPGARFLLLTGVRDWFCVGGSGPLMEQMLASDDRDWRAASIGRFQAIIAEILACPLFTVALLDGLAAGAGADMVLAADLTLATEAARFALLYAKLGLIPDAGFGLLEWRFGHRALLAYADSKVLGADDLVAAGVAEPLAEADLAAVLKLLRRRFRFVPQAFTAAKAQRNAWLFGDLAAALDDVARRQAALFDNDETRRRLLHSAASQRGHSGGRPDGDG